MGQQLLSGTGFPQQQYRGVAGRPAPGAALDFQAGRAGTDEVAEAVFRLARLQQGAGRGQLGLHALVAGQQR
ncbi:hypothetical protein D9M72_305640 [compost metagenome]